MVISVFETAVIWIYLDTDVKRVVHFLYANFMFNILTVMTFFFCGMP